MTAKTQLPSQLQIPTALSGLADLASNLWWTWDPDARSLMAGLDPARWDDVKHNPVALLIDMEPSRLEALATDDEFLARVERIVTRFRVAMQPDPDHELAGKTVAYFCAEFGIHESMPIYSGGLGILAGDHLKSASDLGLPLVAVGMAYKFGYFHQLVDVTGRQTEHYLANDYQRLPAVRQCNGDEEPIILEIAYPGRTVRAQIWKVMVGRVALYLLDTDLPENNEEDRMITGHLYGGNEDTRIRQEILLGVGGLRALEAVGINPDVCHLNEGHSAFLSVEQIRRAVSRQGLSFTEAVAESCASNVFTTHTPVAAGNDAFSSDHVREYLKCILEGSGVDLDQLMALGQDRPDDANSRFGMTVLALHTTRFANGVSELHGKVARFMWHHLWPEADEDDIPIAHVTNGVHMASWIAPDLDLCYREHLTEDGLDISDAAFWNLHQGLRRRLVDTVRIKLAAQRRRHGASAEAVAAAASLLDPEALTIGFARRFAPYKRATLLLRDRDRLAALLGNTDRPLQILMAGKAHPMNEPGKALMQEIWRVSQDPMFAGRIQLVEGYNIALARFLVQGVDVWLNTPRRPLEASGTSGMKAAANGAPNLSISDGWWVEGFEGGNGWVIGDGREHDTPEAQDAEDVESLFTLLEKEVVPTFYDRGSDGVPRKWVKIMRAAVAGVIPEFSTARMVNDYTEDFYGPTARRD